MTHTYELRKFNEDGSTTTVKRITAEPKYAKQMAKEYAEQNRGIYSLNRIETVANFFTERD